MNVQSLRVVRLFLWGILIVVLLTVGTMYLIRASILNARREAANAVAGMDEKRTLAPMGDAPQFSLTNQDGDVFDVREMSGHVYVVDFFFTECLGICPTLQKNMKRVQDAFKSNDKVRLLSISVDPKNDTPAVLAKRAKVLGADLKKWDWTVGPNEKTGKIASGYKLMGTLVPGDILHSNRFVLVDGYGKIRGYYNGTEDGDVDAIIEDISRLLGE
jgi:protein SCO1/2